MEVYDVPHCLGGVKRYSEAILQRLTDRRENASCRSYGKCATDIVGGYELGMDDDRHAEFLARPVPKVSAQVNVSGKVTEDLGAPVVGANVCIFEHNEIPCSRVSSTGDYTLRVPAAAEVTLVATAAGYGGLAVPLATSSRDTSLSLVLFKEALARARRAGFGLAYGDTTTGSVFVTVLIRQCKPTGLA
jgi:hypothetical protein